MQVSGVFENVTWAVAGYDDGPWRSYIPASALEQHIRLGYNKFNYDFSR